MKFLVILACAAASASALVAEPRVPKGKGAANTGNAAAATSGTLVLKEVNGVPGNECLTFRNNGKHRYWIGVWLGHAPPPRHHGRKPVWYSQC